jgi:aerobic carbon-monoxide dehydrogenase medium subunit
MSLLARHRDDAKVLAGGQSLVPLMNLRLAAPEILIDLNRLSDLAHIRRSGDFITIGALTRICDIGDSELLSEACPLLNRAAGLVGYPAIRSRGTLGGSLAHADPAAELPLIATTLDAELTLLGPDGRRTVAASDFFLGYFTTATEPDELLLSVRFPVQPADAASSLRTFCRKSGDFALAATAIELSFTGDVVSRARIGVGGVADRPVRARQAEAMLEGQPLDEQAIMSAPLAVAADSLSESVGADDGFRRHLVETLARRTLADLAASNGSVA